MDRVQEVWRTQGMKKMNNEREKNNITFFVYNILRLAI